MTVTARIARFAARRNRWLVAALCVLLGVYIFHATQQKHRAADLDQQLSQCRQAMDVKDLLNDIQSDGIRALAAATDAQYHRAERAEQRAVTIAARSTQRLQQLMASAPATDATCTDAIGYARNSAIAQAQNNPLLHSSTLRADPYGFVGVSPPVMGISGAVTVPPSFYAITPLTIKAGDL